MLKFFKRILLLIFILLIIGISICYYSIKIEPFKLKVNTINVDSDLLKTENGTIRAVFFADTHFGEYFSVEDFQPVISAINELDADFVFFGGDLIDHFNDYNGVLAEISASLSQIQAKKGKFCVFGNHDYGGGAEFEYAGIMQAGGFSVLKNNHVSFDEYNFSVTGIDDVLIGYGNTDIVSSCRPDFFNIIICHEPDVVDNVLKYNVDIMISGHTHGRQINLKPFDDYILPDYGRKYVKGRYDFDNDRKTFLYVNSGIGMTKLPLRFASPPEITLFELSGK